ncbi:cytochrome c oxidase cbb3-type subunit 3 [Povalibacter uvarum]|uniref:Cytochrome c oxidase cbb3-type subunit 3 n=1 Tax=Povalibacter uvarum TaxID=732238 RepID=A0A841HXH1_9GAMM|nr:c-type cytochrome [Povalibacter uvarum]MBB6096495.1 cytochrome c oxidase cbb3-type subunit 3 [Povalibacter uvarum]
MRWLGWIALAASLAAAAVASGIHEQSVRSRLLRADPDLVASDPQLVAYAMDMGALTYSGACSGCHGPALTGDRRSGVPDLTDSEWLYGTGRLSEIERIVLYGIRSGYSKGWNLASMPAFARAKPYASYHVDPLKPGEVDDVTTFVLSLQNAASPSDAVERGKTVFLKNGLCFDCHGADARGDPAIGAPDLTDAVWLYGNGSAESIHAAIAHGMAGSCPGNIDSLSFAEIRAVALYVHSKRSGGRAHDP